MVNVIFDFDGTTVDGFEIAITLFNDYAQTQDFLHIKAKNYEKLKSPLIKANLPTDKKTPP
ncbi:HAD hydrolase-like protein [Candidatus Coxiella mudrowiae]|uniref:HAD hydrolase-like protein n=1 Tax=Candidatus Coxiella mudrowiae TaxID=2054173 RepID=UPI000C28D7C1|nr:HAD hydrolase-like protein [Candidatus Coxiella mudrowiae]